MRALDFNTRTQVTRLVERQVYCWSLVWRRRKGGHLVVVLMVTSHGVAKRPESYTSVSDCKEPALVWSTTLPTQPGRLWDDGLQKAAFGKGMANLVTGKRWGYNH